MQSACRTPITALNAGSYALCAANRHAVADCLDQPVVLSPVHLNRQLAGGTGA